MNRPFIAVATALALTCLAGVHNPAAAGPVKKAVAKAKAARAEPTLPAADSDQLAAAAMTLFGAYQCEMNQSVQVAMNSKFEGYVDVQFGSKRWIMKPVLSSTGALRLEDVKGQTLMLQIAHKSMVMDVKLGRRLVDECMHEEQAKAKAEAQNQPAAPSMMGN